MHQLVLASQSPRRRQILSQAGYELRTSSVKVSEIPRKNLNLPAQVRDLAQRKAQALVESDKSLKKPGILLLAADTVVLLDNQMMGKPKNFSEAQSHIRRLSGRRHVVLSGVCLWQTCPQKIVTFHESTVVEFRDLSEEEILLYAQNGEGLDKAGGYGIQGEGRRLVKAYHGSFQNVVGLPLEKLQTVLAAHQWNLFRVSNAERESAGAGGV